MMIPVELEFDDWQKVLTVLGDKPLNVVYPLWARVYMQVNKQAQNKQQETKGNNHDVPPQPESGRHL